MIFLLRVDVSTFLDNIHEEHELKDIQLDD